MARINTTAILSFANKERPVAVREYDIRDTKYIVTATVKAGASEDAAAKVRRLIRKEVSGRAEKN